MQPPQKIGIIAGSGKLPAIAERELTAMGMSVVTCHLNQDFSIGEAGRIMQYFKTRHIKTLILIGGVARPNWLRVKTDGRGFGIMWRILFRRYGDNRLLSVIRQELEKEGFQVKAIQEFLPALLCPAGVLTNLQPSPADQTTIDKGVREARAHGLADQGQSIVMAANFVVGREDRSGTAALIERMAKLKGDKILVKMVKPQQDRALDLPAIGPDTIDQAHRSGFKGIAVNAGACLLIDRDELVARANKCGLFVVGVT